MIKIGDKIICIKPYKVGCYGYEEGERWIIENIQAQYTYAVTALKIGGKKRHNFKFPEIDNNWCTLAEWRDKQIDSILDGDRVK